MKICFFGTYNYNYARNSTLKKGLAENGVEIIEVHENIPNERMELPEDFQLGDHVKPVRKLLAK